MNSDDPDAETTSALSEIFGPDCYRNLIITEIHACGDTHTHTETVRPVHHHPYYH